MMQIQLLNQPAPPSIFLPRSEALRYVEQCELAEMTPPNNFLNQILSSSASSGVANNSGSSSVAGGGGDVKKFASIIQMAFLLYLGEYAQARHLWRRHKDENSSSSTDEHKQLAMLWDAAKYCYLWNAGGISSPLNSTDNDEGVGGSNDDDLPYSTLLLRSLQSNVESSLEPLATYSRELILIFRYRVNDRLRSSFGDIREEEFMLRMNYSSSGGDDHHHEDDLSGRYGWKKNGRRTGANNYAAIHLVPNYKWKSPVQVQGGGDFMNDAGDRIRQLSNVVMFLEQTKMNA